MNDIVLHTENLGKRYRIGQQTSARTLREVVADFRIRPFRGRNTVRLDATGPGNLWAIRDVSFDVHQGEIVGIIGRNGSGKSTLLKILSRITEPTEGYAEIRGRVGSLLEVGTGFHPELTGRENIYMNGAILGMRRSEIKRKFEEIVAFAEIDRLLDTPVKRYSSGMYVRLAFAVAAHLEPEILLVDEVLAVGDMSFQNKCLGKMGEVAKGGRTVLFVSHNMPAIANLCSKAICLEEGRIVNTGSAREVITSYAVSQQSAAGEKIWTDRQSSPGNEDVRLKAVRVVSDGADPSTILIDRDIRIEIDYEVLTEGMVLDLAVHLRDNLQSFVLASANRPSVNLTEDTWYGKPRAAGLYRTTCRVPKDFLNDLTYSIDVGIIDQRWQWLVNETFLLSFTVQDTGDMKKEYSGDWVGVVRPRLAWTTAYLGKEETP